MQRHMILSHELILRRSLVQVRLIRGNGRSRLSQSLILRLDLLSILIESLALLGKSYLL